VFVALLLAVVWVRRRYFSAGESRLQG